MGGSTEPKYHLSLALGTCVDSAQLAEHFGCTKTTMHLYLDRAKVPYLPVSGGKRLYFVDHLVDAMERLAKDRGWHDCHVED